MSQSNYLTPLIFNAYKPKGISSYDVVRHFKRNLPKGYGKIGHFGTLDPFACGVLMIGVNGAARLNNFIHDCLPKTYIASGILGIESDTGDLTEGYSQKDESRYLQEVIASFEEKFIQKTLNEKFLGKYFQAPHKYSAAKFEGKALHKWAREGVEIKKDLKERYVYKIKVLEFSFPKLKIEFTVSSGTYVRTLFSDCARHLGTIGCLEDLERTEVGGCVLSNSLKESLWPKDQSLNILDYGLDVRDVLKFGVISFEKKESHLYSNGVALNEDRAFKVINKPLSKEFFWVENLSGKLLGLAKLEEGIIKTQFNLST